eukprot:Gregarina_sp_Pseudo_9__65@NODE_1043_length_1941_cov_71_906414_g977_i0_p1_GENE_NODE_1043_length_1941_cov_71_906414_g977_i0NODE_1043_length_1941_cov_71_906414_g977_i0_p1_ORF_typecomplete_len567_score71_26Amino_oxidase/PF01593_24/5_2e26NAD_binding_8/PF13450_6/7_9e11Thi4/PF01946_17/4_3e06Thi4/PF01946_17/3_8e02Pyr_redox_2/PF07992_14/8_6e05Pyr_redox_2/PF07992_14/2_6e02DAO/PF01266_24/4_6e05Pyr_redox_3/PF13738_6/7_1e05FAD_binding_2/PF00890_24/0_00019FAD_oxidored/PF12831_7/0_00049FMOlike/PF00743_19/0_002
MATSPDFVSDTSISTLPCLRSPNSANPRPRVVIIGGGPCGIGAAVRLQELGYENWCLYEKSHSWGGLSASLRDDEGFLWDIGGHVVFSHYQYFDDVCAKLGPKEYNVMKRKCLLFMEEGRCSINYPLQNHLHQLPESQQLPCLQGLLTAYWQSLNKKDSNSAATEAASSSESSFAEWGKRVLGQGIVDVFLRPYNEKLWSWPLESMGSGWLGERVAVPDFNDVMKKFVTAMADESWGPNSEFKYPAEGGTGAIWKHVGSHLKPQNCKLGVSVDSIDSVSKRLTLSDGTHDSYDVIINTMPLPELAARLLLDSEERQQTLCSLTSQLKYSHVVIVGVGIQGPRPSILDEFQWSYFPQPDAPMFRVTALSNYSQAMCPGASYYSLLCEVGFSEWKPRAGSVDDVAQEVETALRKYGLIQDGSEVVSRFAKNFHYGYPTPSLGRDDLLAGIHGELLQENIISRGRFGGWRYEAGNMDHSMMQGVEAADAILSEVTGLALPFAEQATYYLPNKVNDRANRSQILLTNLARFERTPAVESTPTPKFSFARAKLPPVKVWNEEVRDNDIIQV